jgi:Flp pilus assembly protein TadD
MPTVVKEIKESRMPLLADPLRGTTSESRTLYDLAMEKIKRNHFKEALIHLGAAIRIAPTTPFYRSYFGYCLAQVEGDFERAVQYCRQASDSRPLDPELHVNLGRVYRLKGDNAAAHSAFVQAWHLCKGHPAAAAELTRMGIRRPSVLGFLPRSHFVNRFLGVLRAKYERRFHKNREF